MKGKFVTFEGCEGVGKSTQVRLLLQKLDQAGVDYLSTREPGGSKIAEQIRTIILDANNAEMSDVCEALLYSAARAQHITDVVEPALAAGKLVLCDRFIDSTFAYQGHAKGLGRELVERLNEIAISGHLPDLTIFLDFPPEQAFRRKGGADRADRLENLSLEFHKKVYEGYRMLAARNPDRFVSVDASGTKFETNDKVFNLLKVRGII